MRTHVLAVLAALTGAALLRADAGFDKALADADLLTQQEKYDRAIVAYNTMKDASADAGQKNMLAVRVARVHLARGRTKQATFLLGQLSRDNPDYVPGLVEYARLNLYYLADEAGSLDKAERSLQRARTLEPQNVEVWVEWGSLALARGRYADAIDRFKKVIETMDKTAYRAYHGLARAHLRLDQHEKAREAMRACLEAGPAVAENHWMNGNVELATQDAGCEERAIGSYLYAIGLDDRVPKYKGWAIVTHFVAHRFGQAQPIEKLLQAQAPDSSFVLVAAGMREEMTGKIQAARDHYAAAVDADWNNPWGHWLLANIQNGRGNREVVEAAAFNPFLYGPFVNQEQASKHLVAVQRLAPEFPFRDAVAKLQKSAQAASSTKTDPTFNEKMARFKQYLSKIKGSAPAAGP